MRSRNRWILRLRPLDAIRRDWRKRGWVLIVGGLFPLLLGLWMLLTMAVDTRLTCERPMDGSARCVLERRSILGGSRRVIPLDSIEFITLDRMIDKWGNLYAVTLHTRDEDLQLNRNGFRKWGDAQAVRVGFYNFRFGQTSRHYHWSELLLNPWTVITTLLLYGFGVWMLGSWLFVLKGTGIVED